MKVNMYADECHPLMWSGKSVSVWAEQNAENCYVTLTEIKIFHGIMCWIDFSSLKQIP